MKGLKISLCDDRELWDDFVDSSPQGSIFCKSYILESFENVNADLWIVSRNGRPLMGLPVLHRNNTGLGPLPYSYYQGPIYSPSIDALSVIRRPHWTITLLETAIREICCHYDRLHFCTHPVNLPELRPFQWYNYNHPDLGQFKLAPGYTALLNLSSKNSLKNVMAVARKDRRQDLKIATENGLTISMSKDFGVLEQLITESFERQKLSPDPSDLSQLRAIFDVAIRKNVGELFVVHMPGELPVAAQFALYDLITGHAVASGINQENRVVGGGTLATAFLIEHCLKRNLHWLDFNGANSPDRADFKHSFGATPAMFFRATWMRGSE